MANRGNARLSFAHLLGSTSLSSRRADDDEDNRQDPADADDDSDDDSSDDENARARGRRAADDDNDGDDNEGDQDDDRPSGRRRADDDSDDVDTDEDDENAKAARRQERARCGAIFADKAAATRPDMAAHLAFNTSMSASAAIRTLRAAAKGGPVSATGSLSARMQAFPSARTGMDRAPQSRAQAASSSWEKSAQRVGIKLKA
ncbi:hypothetical protein AA103196_2278 [Ameyamaea chiangmaiensis NBRC 103196]|uniref:Uncharacterized protein n=1 Tax=Ameyamaea chiangmaiensis TaxID=442969 RepID=A0A850P2W1_9PROT|nr:hypothetical protein [Ameyamaea chiangmaiensis]MBS4075463.1 hypothetical protein [Ameyamaea chiangmaiensis]NVN39005.1 hypothetical protein [Ameyamaea chiangmaiensis]GBQ69676.1 hypothetical protein AA103196_2278 [Ameyamaea chiangmaiensis NBRC 103196]